MPVVIGFLESIFKKCRIINNQNSRKIRRKFVEKIIIFKNSSNKKTSMETPNSVILKALENYINYNRMEK